jgi:VIT1/CCC1 family predicted Fe2+/Mn2+ transporter
VGLFALLSGAVSMALGEYVSMSAQKELLERELDLERREIRRRPENERRELAHIYRARGVDPGTADELASQMMRDPDLALETHAREELGIDPKALGSPIGAAVSSFVSFAIGALAPLLPWLITAGHGAAIATAIIGTAAAVAVGAALSRFTGRSVVFSSARQVLVVVLPAAAIFAVGSAIGVATG